MHRGIGTAHGSTADEILQKNDLGRLGHANVGPRFCAFAKALPIGVEKAIFPGGRRGVMERQAVFDFASLVNYV